ASAVGCEWSREREASAKWRRAVSAQNCPREGNCAKGQGVVGGVLRGAGAVCRRGARGGVSARDLEDARAAWVSGRGREHLREIAGIGRRLAAAMRRVVAS